MAALIVRSSRRRVTFASNAWQLFAGTFDARICAAGSTPSLMWRLSAVALRQRNGMAFPPRSLVVKQ
jgi:hypothetical protein